MYYKSQKQAELAGYRIPRDFYGEIALPCIHITGSVRGMKNLGYWDKDANVVRIGQWIYLLSHRKMKLKN